MFKYTKASINIIIDDIKKFLKVFRVLSLLATTAYFVFQIVTKNGILWLNIVLASLFIIFTVLDFVFEKAKKKTVKKHLKRTYQWIKLLTGAFTLGFTIYEIYKAPAGSVNGVSIILATLMIILWIVKLITEILVEYIQARSEMVMVAYNEDVDTIKRPVNNVVNVVRKFTGKQVEEIKEDHSAKRFKILNRLDRKIDEESSKEDNK